ncbi:MAG: glycerol-3-phosphate dehydrogenase [Rhodobacteraceae bacterium]|nr:glycerol-3-phosphate dehydrogenase [Paracoccaceae bacterium]
MEQQKPVADLIVIGGGINGCGIARDAAGRGYAVTLAEMNDLASATSSASTKLFHGGLRYLEYFEFRLVREALIEREVLLRAMPHIAWPMRFVLPWHESMRFESETPTSKLMCTFMPWMRGRRPSWLIRLGLFLYDNLGGRKILPGTATLDLRTDPAGEPLKDKFARAYEYSDCWVQDSRLVALNARDAADRGAEILTRTKVVSARVEDRLWQIVLEDRETGVQSTRQARMLVNAAGPWVGDVLHNRVHVDTRENVRLVRGSHIVTRKLFEHDKCYFFQGTDGRIIFAIPYESDFTLIGTTDQEAHDPDATPVCSEDEAAYLLDFASQYFREPVQAEDIVWTYSGVRPLYDDGAKSATAATREYVLKLERGAGAPLLNVFGGKITTYRRLAEHALERIGDALPPRGAPWTAGAALPGGDFPVDGQGRLATELKLACPFLDDRQCWRMVRTYGTDAVRLVDGAMSPDALGQDFGAGLTEREVRWLMEAEFARTAEDVVWRRTKLGLVMTEAEIDALDAWMAETRGHRSAAAE